MKRRRPASDTPAEAPARSAHDKALALLARREHSRRELHDKLARGGYGESELDEALDRLADQHYQDDRRFGEMLVRSRVGQGYGPARIQAELRSHGLDAAAVADLLDRADVDWTASALAQLRRRYGRRPAADFAERGRRAQFLLRRGFPAATVSAVTRADVDEGADAAD